MTARKRRNSRGGTLALVIALVAMVGLALLFFGLHYVQDIGSYAEQKSAIEAASIAAARDLSKIVYEDPNFGFVALSDYVPKGTGTLAKDDWAVPVHGINTLLATVRLDMILADYMQDPCMQALAQNDYNNAMAARQALVNNLTQIINANGTGLDYDGNAVNPLQDATDAYVKNTPRMEGGKATLVPGSLKLTLGFVDNCQTSRAKLPQPNAVSGVPKTQRSNGYYMPNVSIVYKGKYPMTFAALGNDALIADFKTFTQTPPADNAIPTIVQATAQEQYVNSQYANSDASHVMTVTAAAEAGAIIDQLPCPGQFTLSFSNGPLQAITTLGDIFNNSQIASDPTDVLQTAQTGDFPNNPTQFYALTTVPGQSTKNPQFTYLISMAFYDWLRRAGTNVDVSQLMTTLGNPLNFSGGGPQVLAFEIQPNGNIKCTNKQQTVNNVCVSQNQWRAISGLGLNTTLTTSPTFQSYDLWLTDFVHTEGRIKGGMHAGEPLTNPGVLKQNSLALPSKIQTFYGNPNMQFQSFSSGGGPLRPTYQTSGVACDLTFELRN